MTHTVMTNKYSASSCFLLSLFIVVWTVSDLQTNSFLCNCHLKDACCCLFTLPLFNIALSESWGTEWHMALHKVYSLAITDCLGACSHHMQLQNGQVSLWDKSREKHHHIRILFYRGNRHFWAQRAPCCSNDNQANTSTCENTAYSVATPPSFTPVHIYLALILQGSREASWTPNRTGNILQRKHSVF